MPVNIFKTYITNYKLKLYEQSPNPKNLYAIKHHEQEVILEEDSEENLKKSYKKSQFNIPVIYLEGVDFTTTVTPKVVAKFYHGIWKPAPTAPSPKISPSISPARSAVSIHNSPFTLISPPNFVGAPKNVNSVGHNYKKVHTYQFSKRCYVPTLQK